MFSYLPSMLIRNKCYSIRYIPDGLDSTQMHYDKALHALDMRQFVMAGFKPVHGKNPECTYMVYEVYDDAY